MFYTYILCSIDHPNQRYIGCAADLKARLAKHNAGEVPHTTKFKLWKIEAYFAFETKEKAVFLCLLWLFHKDLLKSLPQTENL